MSTVLFNWKTTDSVPSNKTRQKLKLAYDAGILYSTSSVACKIKSAGDIQNDCSSVSKLCLLHFVCYENGD